jgi:HD superfamily phosphohydrolase
MTARPIHRTHEIKDCIHQFIKHNTLERYLIDSPFFQRLRHIHQLSLNYLVYPGATHKRFEHSLGVAELASRVFDVITAEENISSEIASLVPELSDRDLRPYWRRALRLAALCHDMGHLPFSHAAERELLPNGWDHERMTREIILSPDMREVWDKLAAPGAPVKPEHIVKLAIGPKKAADLEFSTGEAILSEIIVGDAFGVDRIDYLLRDAHHTGVSFGGLDHYRLIDSLRILPPPTALDDKDKSLEPALGVEHGGLAVAEALLLARYFMFSQVYFHPICVIYATHLKEFLLESRSGVPFPTTPQEHLALTDNEITASILAAGNDPTKPGGASASRILRRKHFKILFQRNQLDPLGFAERVYYAAKEAFGAEHVRIEVLPAKGAPPDFRVLQRDTSVASAMVVSRILKNIPTQKQEYVFVSPERKQQASEWLAKSRVELLAEPKEAKESA